jgi:hypothetical protein
VRPEVAQALLQKATASAGEGGVKKKAAADRDPGVASQRQRAEATRKEEAVLPTLQKVKVKEKEKKKGIEREKAVGMETETEKEKDNRKEGNKEKDKEHTIAEDEDEDEGATAAARAEEIYRRLMTGEVYFKILTLTNDYAGWAQPDHENKIRNDAIHPFTEYNAGYGWKPLPDSMAAPVSILTAQEYEMIQHEYSMVKPEFDQISDRKLWLAQLRVLRDRLEHNAISQAPPASVDEQGISNST